MLLLVWFRQIPYCSKCFLIFKPQGYSTILSIQNLKSKQTHITGNDFNNVHIFETLFQRKKMQNFLSGLCCGGRWPAAFSRSKSKVQTTKPPGPPLRDGGIALQAPPPPPARRRRALPPPLPRLHFPHLITSTSPSIASSRRRRAAAARYPSTLTIIVLRNALRITRRSCRVPLAGAGKEASAWSKLFLFAPGAITFGLGTWQLFRRQEKVIPRTRAHYFLLHFVGFRDLTVCSFLLDLR